MVLIYKWLLNDAGLTTLHLPKDAQVLSIQKQGEGVYLWALFEEARQHDTSMRVFFRMGTGSKYPYRQEAIWHIATLQDGCFVWHWFEKLGD